MQGSSTLVARVALLAALLGGAGAVAAEVVFTRHFALLFGITAPAAATVVAVYMVGMALGAGLGGRLADRLGASAGWLYVGAEWLGLLWCLAFLPLFGVAEGVTADLPASWTLPVSALATALLVGPAAVASGATFPALIRLIGDEDTVRTTYAANVLGAAAGALCAGLWLPQLVGLSGTLYIAAGLLALAGLLMLPFARGGAPGEPTTLPVPTDPVSLPAALAAYAVLGGVGMGAEIGWTRLLEQTGPNPGSLTFPLVLTAYLLGLALGGVVLAPRLRRLGESRALGVACATTGVATLLGLVAMMLLPPESLLGHHVGPGPGNQTVFQLTGVLVSADRLLVYLLAAGVPGVASGAAFPIAVSALARASHGLGRGVGLTAATGIAASVVMSLWMGFLPSWGPGVVRLFVLMAMVSLLVATWLTRSRWVGGLALVGLLGFFVPPWAGLQTTSGEWVVAFVETAAGPSAVTHDDEGRVHVYTHGEKVPGLDLDLEVPLALHPDPKRVVLIAFGTGRNTARMLDQPGIEDLQVVDIDPALPTLANDVPGVGGGLFLHERATYYVDDGRHHVRLAKEPLDVIYSDVATYAQYAGLGTVEFFETARARLGPNGLMVLKLHVDTLTVEGLERFVATFLHVFPESALFSNEATPVLVGFTRPIGEQLAGVRPSAEARYGEGVWQRLGQRVLSGPDGLVRLAKGAVLTDDHPMGLAQALVGPTVDPMNQQGAVDIINRMDRTRGPQAAVAWFGPGAPIARGHRFSFMMRPVRQTYLELILGDSRPEAPPPPPGGQGRGPPR